MDDQRISYLLGEIRENLELARDLLSQPIEDFLGDIRNRYTLRHVIIEIVEASVAFGLYILREMHEVEKVDGYTSVFRKMMEKGIISPQTSEDMVRLVRLRNLIIHKYWEVDDVWIYKEFKETDIGVIERFISEVEEHVFRDRGEGIL